MLDSACIDPSLPIHRADESDMTIRSLLRNSLLAYTLACLAVTFSGCAHDTYQHRAEIIKDHVEAFYSHLKANRVGAAVHENQQIEAMADEMAETVTKRVQLQGTSHAEREFALMKTARETAAQNWIALGQYFAINRQTDQARATYQRVVETYTNPTERTYREQAARALKDLTIVSPAPGQTSH
jgi:TolA-binding protein